MAETKKNKGLEEGNSNFKICLSGKKTQSQDFGVWFEFFERRFKIKILKLV